MSRASAAHALCQLVQVPVIVLTLQTFVLNKYRILVMADHMTCTCAQEFKIDL